MHAADIQFPEGTARFILYQRSQHLRFTRSRVYRTLRPIFGNRSIRIASAIESRLRPLSIQREYWADIYSEYENMLDALPDRCESILDIGCGLGAIHIALHRHYAQPPPDFFLLDRSSISDRVEYGFKGSGEEFYNSLELTKELLVLNEVPERLVHTIALPCTLETKVTERPDLVISLISWGFHYPLEVYLDEVFELMAPGAHLIVDIRNGSGGEELLRSRFGGINVLFSDRKRQRILSIK